mmetsp:Transcript_823/g.1137  ORF Transcript_823/g.1137 Transcript_823/m.1137 type:complete len:525 (+) Transcript_823:122-1696(+)
MDISSSDHPSCTPPNETASSVEASVIDDMGVGTGVGVGTVIRMLTTLTAKYGKERIILSNLDSHGTDIGKVKQLLYEQTNILPKRQKLIGLVIDKTYKASRSTSVSSSVSVSSKMLSDDLLLCHLQVKPKDIKFDTINNTNIQHNQHSFILMGTPEVQIQKLTSDNHNHNNNNSTNNNNNNNNNQVINDFDLEFNAGSIEWLNHFANDLNLQKFTNSTQIHIMNPPRMGKPLMVLDLDHTLLDFSSKTIMNTNTASSSTTNTNNTTAAANNNNSNNPSSSISNAINIHEKIQKMKRPFMDEFLSIAYQHYDLCVWSQTSWRWLETKLVELNMVHNPNYKFCFVLDKTSMFAISANNNNNNNNNNNIPENASIANNTSNNKKYKKEKHYVKPLQIIWSKYPQYWNETNTIHLDDLGRNFALNIQNGLKVSAYYRKKSKGSGSSGTQKDVELVGLARYCAKLAMEVKDFTCVDFNYWKDVVNGTRQLVSTSSNSKSGNGGGGGGGSKKNDNDGGKGGNGNGMEKQP